MTLTSSKTMSLQNNTTKQDMVFPDNSAEIISNILKRHVLEETDRELFEKFQQKQESIGSIVASLLKKVAIQELPQKNIPLILKEKLKITAKKAQDLSKDLETQILSKVRPRERDITRALKNKTAKAEQTKKQVEKQPEAPPEKKKIPAKDTYRETFEE